MTDKMREEFEAAACAVILADHPGSGLTVEEIKAGRDGSSYKSSTWAGMWWAWQASRETLIEKLATLEWAPCVLQEAIDASGVEPC